MRIFVFGEIVVADAVVTNDTPTMTLNLISEDFPTIDSVPVVSETSVTEGESTSITISINSAGSEDIYVPISMMVLSFPLFLMGTPVRMIIAAILLLTGSFLIYKRTISLQTI